MSVYEGNTSSVYPDGCPGDCYDAIIALRPESTFVEQEVEVIEEILDTVADVADEVTSQIFPTFPKPNPPIKAQVAWSVMWWDWLNAEENVPCWKSTRWEMIKNFHRYSPCLLYTSPSPRD